MGNHIGRNQDGADPHVYTTWTYDSSNQLIGQQWGGGWGTYVYDPVGNMLVKNQQGTAPMSFSYDAANRIVTMTQGSRLTTYTYDANGNLSVENLLGSLTNYLYDNENRLNVLMI